MVVLELGIEEDGILKSTILEGLNSHMCFQNPSSSQQLLKIICHQEVYTLRKGKDVNLWDSSFVLLTYKELLLDAVLFETNKSDEIDLVT